MAKVNLYLMSKKGYDVLNFLIQKKYTANIKLVVGSKDMNIVKDYFDEIKALCVDHKIDFIERTETVLEKAEFSIAISWRWIIADMKNLIVIHDSILPRYRGFAPLVNCLKNGEKEIGVTALMASAEYDKGDVIDSWSQMIAYPITISEAIDKISKNYIEAIEFLFTEISADRELKLKKQDETKASFSLWLDDEDYKIDWNQSSDCIKRFIDAVGFPYNGASTTMDGKMVRVIEAVDVEDVKVENRKSGKVIFMSNGFPVVVCGQGLLQINNLKDDLGTSLLPLRRFRTRFT